MIDQNSKHLIITMIVIIVLTTSSGILLFNLSENTAKKKTDQLKLETTKPQINRELQDLKTYTMITHI